MLIATFSCTGQTLSPPRLTAGALSSLANEEKTQLKDWLKMPQEHEELAVEGTSSRSIAKTEKSLQDFDKKFTGDKAYRKQ